MRPSVVIVQNVSKTRENHFKRQLRLEQQFLELMIKERHGPWRNGKMLVWNAHCICTQFLVKAKSINSKNNAACVIICMCRIKKFVKCE